MTATREIESPRYEVIVGNIGSVILTDCYTEARGVFDEYYSQSVTGYGRAAGEEVELLDQGEPLHYHH